MDVDFYLLGIGTSVIGTFLIGFFGLPYTFFEATKVVIWGHEPWQKILRQFGSWLGLIFMTISIILQIKYR